MDLLRLLLRTSAWVFLGVSCAFVWRSCSEQRAFSERVKTEQQQRDAGSLIDGAIVYCGETIPMDSGRLMYPNSRQFDVNGIEIFVKSIPSVESLPVELQIESVDHFRASCFDESISGPIWVTLSCDQSSEAAAWSDFSKRRWLERIPLSEHGLVVLKGDSEGRLVGFNYVASPAAEYRPGGAPYQGTCHEEPGTSPYVTQCQVAYRRGRMAVRYGYATSSIRPWRQVDEVVRSTLDGRPSTDKCPFRKSESR